MKVTVFGATGVVGQALVPLLAEHELTAVSRTARDEPAVERELRRPEREQRRAAEQLQVPPAARPARPDAAAGEAVDGLPVGDPEGSRARLGRLDDRFRYEHPLARLEAAGLEHALRSLPAAHAAITIGEG